MTLDEALEELRTDGTATADEVRRAYLRLLKTRKPEADPDGFQRLREAYEVARGQLARRQGRMVRLAGPSVLPPGPMQAQRPPDKATAPADTAPPENVAPDTAPGETSPPDTTPTLGEVQRLIAEDATDEAAVRLAMLYGVAATRPDVGTPDARVAMELLLKLHERGRVEHAITLGRSFYHWLDTTGQEVRILAGSLAARWALCKELGRVSNRLSGPVRAVMAQAARSGNLQRAKSELAGLRRRNALAASADAVELRASGGALASKLADCLSPPGPPVPGRRRLGARPWLLILPFTALMQVLNSSAKSCESHDATETVRSMVAPRAAPPLPAVRAVPSGDAGDAAKADLDPACGGAPLP